MIRHLVCSLVKCDEHPVHEPKKAQFVAKILQPP